MTELLIENEQSKIEPTDELIEKIRQVTEAVLLSEDCDFDAQISVTFVDNEQIHALNREHRGIDRPTDVLSFPMLEFDEDGNADGEAEVDPGSGAVMLGDIVLSLERAQQQAKEYGHSFLREVCFLTAHSMLHLLGYDHVDDSEGERIMSEKQEAVLSKLGITRP